MEAQEVAPVKSRRRPEEPTAKEVADHIDLHEPTGHGAQHVLPGEEFAIATWQMIVVMRPWRELELTGVI